MVRGDVPQRLKAEVQSKPVIAALKRCATQRLYAALKRRSSTVLLAAAEAPSNSGRWKGLKQKQGQRQRTGVSAPHRQFSTRGFIYTSTYPHEAATSRERGE